MMRCPSCHTELLHAANFCPVCGAGLSAPDAMLGGQQHPDTPDNVVYLPDRHEPPAPHALPANPHAADYVQVPPAGLVPGPGAAEHHPIPGRGPAPYHQVGGPAVSSAPPAAPTPPTDAMAAAESFFSAGDDAFWRDDVDADSRVLGAGVAMAGFLTLGLAIAWYVLAFRRGYGGAEAGGLVLASALMWIWYLSLPREQQHARLLSGHARVRRFVDERVDPLQRRTQQRIVKRRERDNYRAMRSERTRRVTELGELAYRHFRRGGLDPELHQNAQRVMAIEQQMLMQDQRLEQLHRPAD